MCGISGIVNFDQSTVSKSDIQKMMRKMKHRGPDDEGLMIDNDVGLGFVRLSILDLSAAGNQPMYSHDGRFVIVYNGEVYNYVELKDELKRKHHFKTGTDTEVILAAYQEWGAKCLDKFNGMFAFVIFDKKTRDIFGVRDRFGIKPLYYSLEKDRFIFASEIKSILVLKNKKYPNDSIIYDYLMHNRTDHSEETFFKDIKKLQHGTSFSLRKSKLNFNRWYKLNEKLSFDSPFSPQNYKDLLKDSLKLRLRSDVPIGVSLSGGIDSSAIAALLVKAFNLKEINTFSAVYGSHEPTDESRYIREFAPIIKHMHYTSPSADSFYKDYSKFIEAHNEPVTDIGPYAQFKVMELATNFVTVTLDGQGADEQLGGYHYFMGSYYIELLRKFNLSKFLIENLQYYKNHKSSKALKYFLYYLLPEWVQNEFNKNRFPSVNTSFNESKNPSAVNKMLYAPKSLRDSLLQHFEYKLEHLLRWEDLNAMCFSIESRVPFLDHRLVEKTLSLPSISLINKGTTKYILREAVRNELPRAIYERMDKKGFSNPRAKWFREQKFKELIEDTIHSKSFKERGYFDSKIAQKRYNLHLNGSVDLSQEIWKWLNLEIWFNKFVDP